VALLFSKAQHKKKQVCMCVCVDRKPSSLTVQQGVAQEDADVHVCVCACNKAQHKKMHVSLCVCVSFFI